MEFPQKSAARERRLQEICMRCQRLGPRYLVLLSEKEEEAYLEKWELELSGAAKDRLRELGCGHPLFLRIEALRLKELTYEKDSTTERVAEELSTIEAARCDWWDYLDVYVYDQWNVELLEFLMDLSIVEQFDLSMVQMITKKMDAGIWLCKLKETGNFISEHAEGDTEIYELRTPVKLSMRRRLRKCCTKQHIDMLFFLCVSVNVIFYIFQRHI